jgi:hypothetical protein
MSEGWPPKSTGTMTFVAGVSLLLISEGEIVSVEGSISANTGLAPE